MAHATLSWKIARVVPAHLARTGRNFAVSDAIKTKELHRCTTNAKEQCKQQRTPTIWWYRFSTARRARPSNERSLVVPLTPILHTIYFSIPLRSCLTPSCILFFLFVSNPTHVRSHVALSARARGIPRSGGVRACCGYQPPPPADSFLSCRTSLTGIWKSCFFSPFFFCPWNAHAGNRAVFPRHQDAQVELPRYWHQRRPHSAGDLRRSWVVLV